MKTQTNIDIIKTPHGYSIIQQDALINKPAPVPNHHQPAITPTNKLPRQQKHPQIVPKKFVPQQTFTIYPYLNSKPLENHTYMIIPSRCQWFNLNSVHQIERKALPEWFKQKKGLMATMNNMKFEKNQELYKKYRNYIIEMGKSNYINPTMSRKGLAGDACAIIRIHEFLEKWGLINFVHKKKIHNDSNTKNIHYNQNTHHTESNSPPIKRKDGFDRDKTLIAKIYEKDDMELLRKITKCFRPICTSCESLCGIAWYEYKDMLTKKCFTLKEQTSTRQVVSGEQFEYHLKVCFSCYAEKNYPVVLGVEDFAKRSIIEKIKEIKFDEKYGKRKIQQWVRVAEALEKNKFKIGKCAQVLKLEQRQVLDILMQMPVQNLQKISRIQQQTQDEEQVMKVSNTKEKEQKQTEAVVKNPELNSCDTDEEVKSFRTNMEVLEWEEKKYHEQFLQAWLLKIYTKMEELEEWDKAVQWKLSENESIKRHDLAERLRKCIKTDESQ